MKAQNKLKFSIVAGLLLLRREKYLNQDFKLIELMNLIKKNHHQINQANRIKSWFRPRPFCVAA